jgi:putative ABC transport system permease protein
MKLPWVWAPMAMTMTLAVALSMTLIAGFIGTWRLLGRPAGPILRTP